MHFDEAVDELLTGCHSLFRFTADLELWLGALRAGFAQAPVIHLLHLLLHFWHNNMPPNNILNLIVRRLIHHPIPNLILLVQKLQTLFMSLNRQLLLLDFSCLFFNFADKDFAELLV